MYPPSTFPSNPPSFLSSTSEPSDTPSPSAYKTYLGRLSAGSQRTMRNALDSLATMMGGRDGAGYPWHELRAVDVRRLRKQLAAQVQSGSLASSTANKRLSALRGVLREARERELMPTQEAEQAIRAAANLLNTKSARRRVTLEEMEAYMNDCIRDIRCNHVKVHTHRGDMREERIQGHQLHGARDAALVALGYGCGLKSSEVRALKPDHVASEARFLEVPGKWGRTLVLTGGTRHALVAWLRRRPEHEKLFFGVGKYGTPFGDGLSQQGLNGILHGRQYYNPFSFQDLRRTFRANLKASGVRDAVRRSLLGLKMRSKEPTTLELQAAMDLIYVPFDYR